LAEPCYFSPPCCSGLPVLPEAGAGPKATSAHTSSVGKQAWPLVNQIKPKKTCKYSGLGLFLQHCPSV
jgi:hypothetical protein